MPSSNFFFVTIMFAFQEEATAASSECPTIMPENINNT
jgi:hypothetical protein